MNINVKIVQFNDALNVTKLTFANYVLDKDHIYLLIKQFA